MCFREETQGPLSKGSANEERRYLREISRRGARLYRVSQVARDEGVATVGASSCRNVSRGIKSICSSKTRSTATWWKSKA